MYYRGKLDPDVSEMPGLVMHARDVRLVSGIAEYEPEPVRVIAEPYALLREAEIIIAVRVFYGSYIYRQARDVL